MSTQRSAAEIAERLASRRTRLLWFQGLFFLIWQTSFFAWGAEGEPLRNVDHVRIGAWVAWVLALMLFLGTGGGFIHSREVRRMLNDEVTIANRRSGQAAGFFAAILAGVAVFGVNLFEPVTALDAIHAILTVAIGAAILRFAMLERRAEREA